MSISSPISPTEWQESPGNDMNESENSFVGADVANSELPDNEQDQTDLQKINEISRCISSGTDRKDLAKETIGTECSWEKFLVPAPMSVAILGQLMALGTKIDFSLRDNEPEGGFQFVKNPESFRACLVQLSIAGTNAFSSSHTNMDKIKLYAMQFQVVMKDIIPLLLGETNENNTTLITDYLGDLQTYTTKCKEISVATCKHFETLMDLLLEVQLASTAAKGLHESKVMKVKEQKRIFQQEKELNKKKQLDIEENKNALTEQLSLAKADLSKAIEEMPGPLVCLAIETWENIISAASSIGSVLQSVLIPVCLFWRKGVPTTTMGTTDEEENTTNSRKQQLVMILHQATAISSATDYLSRIIEKLKDTDTDQVELSESMIKDVDCVIKIYREVMEKLEKTRGTATYNTLENSIATCAKGISLCNKIRTCKAKVSQEMEDILETIKSDADSLELQSKLLLAPGSMYDCDRKVDTKKDERSGLLKKFSKKLYTKIEMRKQELDDLRQREKENQRKAEELQNNQAKIFEGLVKANINEIDFNQITEMLSRSLEAFGQIREQWQFLSMLFSKIAERIEISLQESKNHFTRRIRHGGSDRSINSSQVILQLAATTNANAHSIQIIAKTYTDISGKYLIGPTAGLASIIGLDPIKDEEKLQKKRDEITKLLETAQSEIRHLAEKSRAQQLKAIDDQFERIDALGMKLPALPLTNRITIQTKVKESYQTLQSELRDDDYI